LGVRLLSGAPILSKIYGFRLRVRAPNRKQIGSTEGGISRVSAAQARTPKDAPSSPDTLRARARGAISALATPLHRIAPPEPLNWAATGPDRQPQRGFRVP